MPDRLVRDSILDSDRVNSLSFGAEILYRRIMSIADDYGRYEARITALKGKCYPVRPNDDITNDMVAGWFDELVGAGLIRCYTIAGKDYLEIQNFRQRLRSMKGKFPPPPWFDSNLHADDSRMSDNGQSSAVEEKGREVGREEKRREEKGSMGADALAPASPPPPASEPSRKLREKQRAMLGRRKAFYDEAMAFSSAYPDALLQAFITYWTEPNKSRTKMRFEQERTWEISRRLSTWEQKDHEFRRRGSPSAGAPAEKHVTGEEVEYLYQRFLEGAKLKEIVQEKHCDFLLQAGIIQLEERFVQAAALWRAKQLTGTNNAAELRMIEAYHAGTWPADEDCRTDEPNRTRIAKKLALIDFFQKAKALNLKTITDAKP